MRLYYLKRDPGAGTFKPQTKREKGKRATHARHAAADQDKPVHAKHPDRSVVEQVKRQHDRANKTRAATDGRETETLAFRADAKLLGIPQRGKPYGKKERRNLRNAKAKSPALYAKLLAQYSDPTRR